MEGLPWLVTALETRRLEELASLAREGDGALVATVNRDGLHKARVAQAVDTAFILTHASIVGARAGEILLGNHAEGADSRRRADVFVVQASSGRDAGPHPLTVVRQVQVAPEHVARVLVAVPPFAAAGPTPDVPLRSTAVTLAPETPPCVVHGNPVRLCDAEGEHRNRALSGQ